MAVIAAQARTSGRFGAYRNRLSARPGSRCRSLAGARLIGVAPAPAPPTPAPLPAASPSALEQSSSLEA
jgi:hypothetical protein